MRRREWLGALGAVTVAGCAGTDENPDRIRPVTEPGNRPFSFEVDGTLRGFDIALAEAVVGRTDEPLGDWRRYERRSMRNHTIRGTVDLIAASKPVTDDYESLTATDRYYRQDQTVIVASGRSDDLSRRSHLRGDTVGVRVGTASESQLRWLIEQRVIDQSAFVQFDTYPLAVEGLRAGSVDSLIVDRPVARVLARTRPVRAAFQIDTGEGFGFLMRDDDERVEPVNEAIRGLRATPAYGDLIENWLVRGSR